MDQALSKFHGWRRSVWAWFVGHAQSRHALWWLAAVAFIDGIISPVPTEVFLVALMLAHPARRGRYFAVALPFSVVGAAGGYLIAHYLFVQFGGPVLDFYGLGAAFAWARRVLAGHIVLGLLLANLTPVPDKVFIYVAGFLGIPFLSFMVAYALVRGGRMWLVMYLTGRFGPHIIDLLRRYALVALALLIALGVAYYGMVHWHLLPL